MTERIAEYFDELNDQLRRIEKKYNPKENDLHFEDEAIPNVDDQLFYDLLQLSGKAIEIIKDQPDHYSNRTAYAHRMFDFWYDYFLIISSASIRVKKSVNSDDYSKETIHSIIQDLIDISEFSIIVSGDLYFRNHEALGNTLLAFYSDDLIDLVRKKKKTIKSKSVKGFLDDTIKAVEEIRMRDMHWTKWKTEIDQAIAVVCLQVIKEPLIYFSEADIQQLLVEELRKIKPISKLYPTSVRKGKDSKGAYSTSLLHREYGGGERTRTDVVIFDPDDVKAIDSVNLMSKNRYLNLIYAFELGTEKTTNISEHVKNDLGKLSRRIKENGTGYLIQFYMDNTQARTGTDRRENTEEKIERVFKKAFDNTDAQSKQIIATNVKILSILLRTYRDQKKMRGKCEVFNGQEWIKTNVSRDDVLRKAILKQLA